MEVMPMGNGANGPGLEADEGWGGAAGRDCQALTVREEAGAEGDVRDTIS